MNAKFLGQFPFYEVWYGKLNISPQKAFWFRYTTLHGKTKESALWAIFFNGSRITARKKTFSLNEARCESYIHLPLGQLTQESCEGDLGAILWQLTYQDRQGSFDPVPTIFKKLHLAKSLVCTPFIDLRFSGKIIVEAMTHDLHEVPGMIGHVWGKKQALCWSWAHCNQFKEKNVVFEGLSAKIPLLGWASPPLTSLYLKVSDQEYIFNGVIDLLKTHSTFGYGLWEFCSKNKDVILSGRIQSRPEHVAVITYTDTDDSELYCHNSKLAKCELTLQIRQTGQEKRFISESSAALEWVTRDSFKGKKYL